MTRRGRRFLGGRCASPVYFEPSALTGTGSSAELRRRASSGATRCSLRSATASLRTSAGTRRGWRFRIAPWFGFSGCSDLRDLWAILAPRSSKARRRLLELAQEFLEGLVDDAVHGSREDEIGRAHV